MLLYILYLQVGLQLDIGLADTPGGVLQALLVVRVASAVSVIVPCTISVAVKVLSQ